jgi:6-pyruvoyl-tetrahydropterin synthase
MPCPSRLSQIFIRQVTLLDCALLNPSRGPEGRSWYVDVAWQGHVDADGVVFDFGLAKKSAKATIDAWFDHRLLVEQTLVSSKKGRCTVESHFKTGRFLLDTYPDALALLPEGTLQALWEKEDLGPLCAVLAGAIASNGPENVTQVKVTLRENEDRHKPHYFHYTHSLRNHFGNCQRFHGHSNIVEVFDPEGNFNLEESQRARNFLHGKYLVSPEYVEQMTEHQAHVSYQGSQGTVRLSLPQERLLLLKEESSIENICEHLNQELKLAPGWQVFAYEGLSKGAISFGK